MIGRPDEIKAEVRTDSPAELRRVGPAPMINGPRSGFFRVGFGPGFIGWSVIAWAALALAGWLWVYHDGGRLSDLFSARAWDGVSVFLRDLAGRGKDGSPAFLDGGKWRDALGLAGDTLRMSVLAAGIGATGALATVAFGASNLTYGELSRVHPLAGRAIFLATRGAYILTRAVPELVWALMIVFVFHAGVLAGAIALGIHNFGVLGRLGSEVVEDIDPGPVRALRSAGAGNMQVLFYGVLPQVLPGFVTFLLYRWEVIIRTTAVVGFVSAAGLGYQFRLDFAFFRYTDIALILIVYVLLVWAVDLISFSLRRLAR